MLFVLIFPTVGLVLILVKFCKGLRGIRLVTSGLPALGTLVAVEETWYRGGTRSSGGPYYRMKFQFRARDGQQYIAKYLSTELKPAWWRIYYQQANSQQHNQQAAHTIENVAAQLQAILPAPLKNALADEITAQRANTPPDINELQEMLLYHPAHPERATLPMAFAEGISIDAAGNLQGMRHSQGILASIVPVLVILGLTWISPYLVPH